MKLFFPDCLWSPDKISGAAFLYFHQEEIVLTLHPSASIALSGVNPLTFIPFMENKAPTWKDSFLTLLDFWCTFRSSLQQTWELLEPLRSDTVKTIMFSYPRDAQAWERADDLLNSSTLDVEKIAPLIDSFHASDELFSHLFFEKVLEIQYGHLSADALVEVGKKLAERAIDEDHQLTQDFDWSVLYEYCSQIFSSKGLPQLLSQAYMFRIPMVTSFPDVMLSNSNLIRFLNALPISLSTEPAETRLDGDVVAWEFFRQLLSQIVDPLDKSKVALVKEMREERSEEIERLKNKCYELSQDLQAEGDLEPLGPRVAEVIKAKVSNDLQELLKIDKRAMSELLTELFSDEKTWLAISTFLTGLVSGREIVTAGAAIYGLSRFGAKAVKSAATRRRTLSTNAYTLIYRMTCS